MSIQLKKRELARISKWLPTSSYDDSLIHPSNLAFVLFVFVFCFLISGSRESLKKVCDSLKTPEPKRKLCMYVYLDLF